MEKIKKILNYVSKHNEYYKNIIEKYKIFEPENISQYPILSRKELQVNRYNMFSEGYRTRYFSQQLLRKSSSGTSGIPINIYWSSKDLQISNMALWRRRYKYHKILPTDRCVKFELNAFDVDRKENVVYYTLIGSDNILSINVSLVQDEMEYMKVIKIINEFDPIWLYIQPSVLKKIISAFQKCDYEKPMSLRYIESVGELLPSDLKQCAEKFFGVSVINMYGSEEMNGIAYECPEHNLHVLDENVMVEVQNEGEVVKSGQGEAIITNLNNFCMPLVRYNQGDIIVLKDYGFCNCGCRSPIIDLVVGRTRETILFKNGTEINSFMLTEVMAEVNNRYGSVIKEYKYIYLRNDFRLECEIKLEGNQQRWFANIVESIKDIFNNKLKGEIPFTLNVRIMHECYVENKHKILEIRD